MIFHHPAEELLLDYACGTLREAHALAIACHAAMCAACRQHIAQLERIGGAELDHMEPIAVSDDAVARALAKLDATSLPQERANRLSHAESVDASDASPPPPATDLPYPLRSYVGDRPSELRWRKLGSSVVSASLMAGRSGIARLVRIRPGSVMPRHSHEGQEFTLVLSGGYTDGDARFGPGDFQPADEAITHQPVADPDEICQVLAVQDAPLRLSGWRGWALNKILRF